MEPFTTMLSGGALGALKVAVQTAMEAFLKGQKDKPLTILEREAVSEAADAAVMKLVQPATLADVEKYDPKVLRIKANMRKKSAPRAAAKKMTKGWGRGAYEAKSHRSGSYRDRRRSSVRAGGKAVKGPKRTSSAKKK